MSVTDGNRQGIGSIVRLGDLLQPQQNAGHLHDLLLDGIAIAHHRLLDLHGGVFIGGHALFPGSQQDHAPGLGHHDTGGLVVGEEELLNGNGIGLIPVDDGADPIVDLFQAQIRIQAGFGGHSPIGDGRKGSVVIADHAIAHNGITGVNAQNDHRKTPCSWSGKLSGRKKRRPLHDICLSISQTPPKDNKNPSVCRSGADGSCQFFRGVPGCFWQFDRAAPKPGSHCPAPLPDPPKAADFFRLFCSKTEKTPGELPGVLMRSYTRSSSVKITARTRLNPPARAKYICRVRRRRTASPSTPITMPEASRATR